MRTPKHGTSYEYSQYGCRCDACRGARRAEYAQRARRIRGRYLARDVKPDARSENICRVAGISYRQLDYWVRLGWVPGITKAPGSGNARLFTPEQIDRIKQLARASELRAKSIPELAEVLAEMAS